MKIFALTPVKNEEWILPTYISSMRKIADEIIILDDNSTDNTALILKNAGVIVIQGDTSAKVNMSKKRLALLKEGRKRGGTHFIWLDADESFDANFLKNGRKIISKLKPGRKITLPWITLWKTIDEERVDGVWKENFKDVIVHDITEYSFENRDLSEGRTQGPNTDVLHLSKDVGQILHFQFLNFDDASLKQAWYRCLELSQSKKSPQRINNMYSVSLDTGNVQTKKTLPTWFEGIALPSNESNKRKWYTDEILKMFNIHGISFFEPLDIWRIQELKDEFKKQMRRDPVAKTFPKWLIKLNTIKNKIKQCLKK
ncbi:glycosyltransferase [Arenimonas sp.]|nr:glycosyltransferase [Candidatus Parcubacteria bacterium]